MPQNPPNRPTLEGNLNVFIQVSRDTQSETNQRLDLVEDSFKKSGGTSWAIGWAFVEEKQRTVA